ncbi:MAG: cadmium-translocating P-type ATPase [Lachnospiraceae bacterium]|jgi:Cd2+/Zn2+-exporting ATPase|nr:cadmium-translocating P-type ATPase [Lachnospiraceae bacterium]
MSLRFKLRVLLYLTGFTLFGFIIWYTTKYQVPDEKRFLLYLAAYMLLGFDVFRRLAHRFLKFDLINEYLIIVLASLGAIALRYYFEAVLLISVFEVCIFMDWLTVGRANKTISKYMDIRPAYATRRIRGKEIVVDPSELTVRQLIVIKPGERIPVDAVVVRGSGNVDTKALTGEAMPRPVQPGDWIYGGCLNIDGSLIARVRRPYKDSTAAQMVETVKTIQGGKAKRETLIGVFAKVYLIFMLLVAVAIALIPPYTFSYGNFNQWLHVGLIFLVIACPFGIIFSTPATFLGGLVSATNQGIIVKGGSHLEELSKADIFVFDKTGTLTEGVFKVKEIKSYDMTQEELLKIAAHVECHSNHPIAKSLRDAYEEAMGEPIDKSIVKRYKEFPGYGVSATFNGVRVHVGNLRMMQHWKLPFDEVTKAGTLAYVIVNKKYAGYFLISDEIKEETPKVLNFLRKRCNAVLVMLTGDRARVGREVAKELKMDYVYTDLMPQQKLEQLEDFLAVQGEHEKLVCVGDGINDAAILARADVGIAMGGLGSAAAIEAADVILTDDSLLKIRDIIKTAHVTLRAAKQNMVFALIMKLIVITLVLTSYFGLWQAIAVEGGVMIASILNSISVSKYHG